jgi:hypothetical protein
MRIGRRRRCSRPMISQRVWNWDFIFGLLAGDRAVCRLSCRVSFPEVRSESRTSQSQVHVVTLRLPALAAIGQTTGLGRLSARSGVGETTYPELFCRRSLSSPPSPLSRPLGEGSERGRMSYRHAHPIPGTSEKGWSGYKSPSRAATATACARVSTPSLLKMEVRW